MPATATRKSTGLPAGPQADLAQRIAAAQCLRRAWLVLGHDDVLFLLERWRRDGDCDGKPGPGLTVHRLLAADRMATE